MLDQTFSLRFLDFFLFLGRKREPAGQGTALLCPSTQALTQSCPPSPTAAIALPSKLQRHCPSTEGLHAVGLSAAGLLTTQHIALFC